MFTNWTIDDSIGEVIQIKYHTDIEPVVQTDSGDWIDLRCSKDTHLKQGEYALIPLGISVKLPFRYEAHIAPRSSTFKNWGIIQTNGVGIIDNSYSGDADEWMMPVYATRDTVIHKNDRICQFRIVRNQPKVRFVVSDSLSKDNRGGFGSTGVY